MSDRATGSRLDRPTIVSLAALSLGIFVVANDFTALSVSVVQIEDDLATSLNRVQWVINAYTVVFAVLIVPAGRLADMYGRRRSFLIGAAVFGAFSLVGGLTPHIELLIAARGLMGVGGAMMWPSVIGMIYAILPDARAGLAGGLVIGVAGLGNAVGPLTAGLLTDLLSWRWVFFVNVPVAVAAILVIRRTVAESVPGERQRIDVVGIATLSAAVIVLLVGLDTGTVAGFDDPWVIGMLAAGVLLLPVFVLLERRRGDEALVPPRIMASRRFSGLVVSVVLMSSIMFGVLVYIPQYTEKTLGWSALAAGAGLLPLMLVFAVVSFVSGPSSDRFGVRPIVGAGAICMTAGALWLGLTVGSGYAILAPGLVVVGVGIGLYFSSLTTAAVTEVDTADASLAGGIVFMGNVGGGSLGLGLNTAVVLSAANLADGIRHAFLLDAALGLASAVIAITVLRRAPG